MLVVLIVSCRLWKPDDTKYTLWELDLLGHDFKQSLVMSLGFGGAPNDDRKCVVTEREQERVKEVEDGPYAEMLFTYAHVTSRL